jgi:hypothetical protein
VSRADIFVGLLGTVVFLVLFWGARSYPYSSQFTPGPGFAPTWYAALGALLSVLIAFNAWRKRHAPDFVPDVSDRAGLLRVGLALVGLFAMMQLSPLLGLILSVLLYLLFLTLVVQGLRWPLAVGTSLGTVVFVILVFQRFLGVPFPRGPLGF